VQEHRVRAASTARSAHDNLGALPCRCSTVSPFQLIATTKGLRGHPSGTTKDVEDTLRFAALTGIRPMTEIFSLEDINVGCQRMLSGDARFRLVLTTGR
jgi:alcohol dehydrogenase